MDWKKYLYTPFIEWTTRFILGSLFIVSGWVKANDLLGFSYKLEEYFSFNVLNLPFLEPYTLPISLLMCVLEIALGWMILGGWYVQLSSILLLGLGIFFGFLTFYSAYFDVVRDCGCFGDALKGSIGRSLTPWESFAKDLILMILLIPILLKRKLIQPLRLKEMLWVFPIFFVLMIGLSYIFSWYGLLIFPLLGIIFCFSLHRWVQLQYLAPLFGMVSACVFGYITYNHLPVRDYLPYAIGKNINEERKTCQDLGLPCPEYGFMYTLRNSEGKLKKVNDRVYLAEKLWEDQAWQMQPEVESIVYTEGYTPAITDFELQDVQENVITQTILEAPKVFLFILYDLEKTHLDVKLSKKMQIFWDGLIEKNISFYVVTANTKESFSVFLEQNNLNLPETHWAFGDGVLLKTMVRSNPGLMYLERAKIVGKWHYNDFPNFSDYELQRYVAYENKKNNRQLEDESALR